MENIFTKLNIPRDIIKIILTNITKSHKYILGFKDNKYHVNNIVKYDENLIFYCIKLKLIKKKKVISTFARYGNLEKIKLFRKKKYYYDETTFENASRYGNLDVMKWLYENNFPRDKTKTFIASVTNGNLSNMIWLYKSFNFPILSPSVFARAARKGNIGNIKWLQDIGCGIDNSALTEAAGYGDIKIIEWIITTYKNKRFYAKIDKAIPHGSVDYIKWLLEKKLIFYYDFESIKMAIKHNRLDIIKLFNSKISVHTDRLIKYAIEKNNLEIFKYLFCNKDTYDSWYTKEFIIAVKNENFEIMKILSKYNISKNNKEIFAEAAINGNFNHIKWLFENGFKYDTRVFMNSAKKGDLNIMKWLLENKFPYDSSILRYAIKNENMESIKWLLENKFPMSKYDTKIIAKNYSDKLN